MEYSYLSLLVALVMVMIDVRLGTRLLRRPAFRIFLLVMLVFMTLVNGYLTARPIVEYGRQFQLGVRIWTIPVEDYLFGFSMVLLTVIVWERYKLK
jgi:lycopene cyclase domain-containing protein